MRLEIEATNANRDSMATTYPLQPRTGVAVLVTQGDKGLLFSCTNGEKNPAAAWKMTEDDANWGTG